MIRTLIPSNAYADFGYDSLAWKGWENAGAEAIHAGVVIRNAMDGVFASGRLMSFEPGGDAGTQTIFEAVEMLFEKSDV